VPSSSDEQAQGPAPGGPGAIERLLGSFAFSVFCCAVWTGLGVSRARALAEEFSWLEVVWLAYNVTLGVLFLIRVRPVAVSLNPIHWAVALLASFSGMFFESTSPALRGLRPVADGMILAGLAGSAAAGLALRRSYDFLPALRGVSTGGLYRFVRHPMYTSALLTRFGYLIRHASVYNAAVFVVVLWLYDRRARIEEQTMLGDPRYQEYARRMRWRFVPGLY
jgi:protein-S-isoprenylcysteine O-methyltransferase Ste14